MLAWKDEGIILSGKNYSENSKIIKIFTKGHGIYTGFVYGAKSKRKIAIYEPANMVQVSWLARTEDNMGRFECEMLKVISPVVFSKPTQLSCIMSVISLVEFSMLEREKEVSLYNHTSLLFDKILENVEDWLPFYVKWELFLLAILGYGLDLSSCVITNKKENLKFVSPKTGKAVNFEAAGKWKNKLLRLPSFLITNSNPNIEDIKLGLKLSENFLHKFAESVNRSLPFARSIFIENISEYKN